jgi:hypothetical protein
MVNAMNKVLRDCIPDITMPFLDDTDSVLRVEHTDSVRRMKEALTAAPTLRRGVYGNGVPIYVTVDTSPTGIGWVVSQEGEDGERFPIRFGAKVLSERQRRYTQVKREL